MTSFDWHALWSHNPIQIEAQQWNAYPTHSSNNQMRPFSFFPFARTLPTSWWVENVSGPIRLDLISGCVEMRSSLPRKGGRSGKFKRMYIYMKRLRIDRSVLSFFICSFRVIWIELFRVCVWILFYNGLNWW